MAYEAILDEVDQLNLAGDRIEGLADNHPPVSEALISIAGNGSRYRNGIGSAGGDKAAARGWSHFHVFKEAHLILWQTGCSHRSETC
jgi:hypothetical protein